MTKLDTNSMTLGCFSDLWKPMLLGDKNRFKTHYSALRGYLSKSQLMDLDDDLKRNDAFSGIYNRLCWENIIVPIYFLNGNSLQGSYKVLTNHLHEKYHFVIFNESEKVIFDPTYEKFPEDELFDGDNCRGVECTMKMLGSEIYYFDLDFYLTTYELPNDRGFNVQLREVGARFISYIKSF